MQASDDPPPRRRFAGAEHHRMDEPEGYGTVSAGSALAAVRPPGLGSRAADPRWLEGA